MDKKKKQLVIIVGVVAVVLLAVLAILLLGLGNDTPSEPTETVCQHQWTDVVTPPTATEKGYTTHTCSLCGESYIDSYTDPVVSKYKPGTLVFCADGVATLYGENDEVVKTYTGWEKKTCTTASNKRPLWYEDRDSILHVIIEENVTAKNTQYWFYEHENLISVTIPASMTKIDGYTFQGCKSLVSVIFNKDSKLTQIGTHAFQACTQLPSIDIPAGVTEIGESVFCNCYKLASVSFAENSQLTTIGLQAFMACEILSDIKLPSSITSIGDAAFGNCTGLPDILNGNLTELVSIGAGAFHNSGLTTVKLCDQNKLSNVGNRAFDCCAQLTSVDFGNNSQLKSIGAEAFSNCSNLTNVTFGENSQLTDIGEKAFVWCEKLEQLSFVGCSQLKSLG